jgi:PAS domain S-box-containing protein
MARVVRLPNIAALTWDDCRLLVDSVQDYAIFMLDVDGYVATWNRGAQKIKGYQSEEIVGKHFSTFYPPEDVEAGKPDAELLAAAEHGRVEDEGFRVRKDGTRFWANVIITALRDPGGELRGFAKVTRDLTERRKNEEELRRSEERLRLLVDAVNDYAIYMLDPEGRVSTWNAGAEKLKGYRTDEIVGQHFSRFFPEEARLEGKPERELSAALESGRFEEEGYRVRKDGTQFWANVVITPVRDDRGELVGFAKVTRDLTSRLEREEMARKLIREQAARTASEASEERLREAAAMAERAAKRAEQASRVKDEFLATVSHELRTPLNAILGWATLLRERAEDPTFTRGLEVIHRNAQAQTKIVDDILDVSRIITGKLHLDLRETDLVAILRDALEVVRPSAVAKGITLSLVPLNAVSRVVADPLRLQQVAWNLLSNAVKFTNTGGKVTTEICQHGSTIKLIVSDTGRGIEPDFLPFVFDRFRQADSSITRRVGGLGLGLSIVKHIVDLHGGHVEAHSEGVGTGATFTVTLPVRAVLPVAEDEVLEAGQASVRPAPRPRLNGLKVLVVDDEPDARELLDAVLANAGCLVRTAGSAAEAFRSFQDFAPDLLVSDLGMPEEDGFSLMRRIRALPHDQGGDVPSVALTAYTHASDRTSALQAGFTTHIAKPVRTDDLLAALQNLAAFARP